MTRSESPYVKRTLARLEAELARSPRRPVLLPGYAPPLARPAHAGLVAVVVAMLLLSAVVGHVMADAIRGGPATGSTSVAVPT